MVASWPTPPLSDGHLVNELDWNLHVDNLNDLNTRLGTVETRTTDASTGNAALGTRVSSLESGKVPTTRTITAGTGLTGGGDLSANRTIAANFGTAAGTIAQGNDSRITVTQDASIGNVALGNRVTTLESRTTNASTGNVALGNRVSALESATAIAHGTARFSAAGNGQTISTDTKVVFPTTITSFTGVTPSGSPNQNFLLTGDATNPHVWLIETSIRVVADIKPQISIVPSATFGTTLPVGHSSGGSFSVACSAVVTLTANTTFAIFAWCPSPGAAISGDFGSHVSFTRLW